jgi:SAM-dependent methyltransferase
VTVRIEDIIQRIRRDVEAATRGGEKDAAPVDADALPAISNRPELDYLNRHWSLFDPLSEMRSHRRLLGPVVLRLKWMFRRLVLGVLDRYFEKERLFLIELVRFDNALAERSDRLLREVTERTKAVAERNDLFLGAMDVRLEALEARDEMRRLLEDRRAESPAAAPDEEEALLAEMAAALGAGLGHRIAPFVDRLRGAGPVLVLGCGAGDVFPELDGVPVTGVEASEALVAQCRARGDAAELAALRSYLETRPEASLGAVIVTRTADRHPRTAWPRLVAATWRSLRPGGVAVFEGLAPSDAARLRWLLARQRFALVDEREFLGLGGEPERVIIGERGRAT